MASTYQDKTGNARNIPKEPIPFGSQPEAQHVADFAAYVRARKTVNVMVGGSKNGYQLFGESPFATAADAADAMMDVFPKAVFEKKDLWKAEWKAKHGVDHPIAESPTAHVIKLAVGREKDANQNPIQIAVMLARGDLILLSDAEYKREVAFLAKRYPETVKG